MSERRVGKSRSLRSPSELGSSASESLDALARVHHAADKRQHSVLPDPVEVVADAEIVDKPVEPGLELDLAAVLEHVDQHRRFDVLIQRLLELELLRPLGVEADRPHVDAGPRKSSSSMIWTVLSSMMRAPPNQERTMFCAIWV